MTIGGFAGSRGDEASGMNVESDHFGILVFEIQMK